MLPHRPTLGNQALTQSLRAPNGAEALARPDIGAELETLLTTDASRWHEPVDDGGLDFEPIKLRTVRRVLRGRLGPIDVHVKVFRADTIAARARANAGAGKGEREARHLLAARELGLATVEPLAHGFVLDAGRRASFLVTRSVAAAPFSLPADDAIAARVGALLRRVHDRGVVADDLHAGNLLVDGDGSPLLCDLTSLRHGGEPSLTSRARGLAFFCNPIDGGPLDPLSRELLRGYRDAGSPLHERFEAALARATRQLRSGSLRRFGKRAMRPCRHTETEPRRRGQPRWFWHLGATGRPREELRELDPSAHPQRRSGRRGGVWLLDDVVVKERDAGKAKKLWIAHYWLEFAGVATATPTALRLHAGRGRVFTERLSHADLRTELAHGDLDARTIATLARALGRAVGRLHGNGLRNRDLKFDNLVRTADGTGLAMVDLDGVTLHGADDSRGAGRDLGRLLAAFWNAGEPGGDATLRRFVMAYVRTRRRLLQSPPMARILRRAAERAGEWRVRHAPSG